MCNLLEEAGHMHILLQDHMNTIHMSSVTCEVLQYLQYSCTWSKVERTLTSPVGSIRTSTVTEVTLSEGGVPSMSPPSFTKAWRKSAQVG